MTARPSSLLESALLVLKSAEADEKIAAAQCAAEQLEAGAPLGDVAAMRAPDRPGRPPLPSLVPPTQAPRRRFNSEKGRAALLHAIGHIEFNAIDLAFDMALRFAEEAHKLGLDTRQFVADWFAVGADEARHFVLIRDRLRELASDYGKFPAHDGLWEAASKTRHSLAARLVVAPLILEARGLDVTPGMIERLEHAGDKKSAAALQIIYDDEIGHVACGKRWFHEVCIRIKEDPEATFLKLKEKYYPGVLKPPFNHAARDMAGLPRQFYEPK